MTPSNVDPPPRAWRKRLCTDICSAFRLKAMAPSDIVARLVAIGDEFAARGELEKAQKAYSDAYRGATKVNDDGTVKDESSGSWLGLLREASQAQETSGSGSSQ